MPPPIHSAATSVIQLYCLPGEAEALASYGAHVPLCIRPRDQWPDQQAAAIDWWLQYSNGRLRLCRGTADKGVCVDPRDITRRALRSSELARACGLARAPRNATEASYSLLDGTCGWGVDGLTLAKLGAEVTLLEQSPVVWALTSDLLRIEPELPATLHLAELTAWLAEADGRRFDVIYLDPMFPPRRKSAAPNKRLQYLAALTGALSQPGETTTEEWVALCRDHARQRVVVKRRRNDPPMAVLPDWQITGRSIRYDVFSSG